MINSITNRYKIDLIILLSIFVYIKKSNLFILLCEKKMNLDHETCSSEAGQRWMSRTPADLSTLYDVNVSHSIIKHRATSIYRHRFSEQGKYLRLPEWVVKLVKKKSGKRTPREKKRRKMKNEENIE